MQELCKEVEEFGTADEGAPPKTIPGRRAAQAEATAEEDEPPKKKRKSKEHEERENGPEEQARSARISEGGKDPLENIEPLISLPQGSASGPLSEQQQGPAGCGEPFASHAETVKVAISRGKGMHSTLPMSAAPTGGASSSTRAPALAISDLLGSSDGSELLEVSEQAQLEDWFLDPTEDLPFIPSPGPSHPLHRDDEPGGNLKAGRKA